MTVEYRLLMKDGTVSIAIEWFAFNPTVRDLNYVGLELVANTNAEDFEYHVEGQNGQETQRSFKTD